MFRTRRVLAMAACAALLTPACKNGSAPSSKGEVVARVGDRPITRNYYEQRILKMDRRFLPDTLDMVGKRKFLDFIINKEVMALKAEELQYGNDPRVINAMKSYEDNLAEKAAIDQLTKGKLDPTDADIQAFYDKKHQKVLTKHVLVKTRHEAEELRKQALAGTDFDSLASRYSTVPRNDVNTGEALPLAQRVVFGEVQFGEAIIPVEEAVFATAMGQVSQPIETGYGWHLFKPVSMTEVTLPPLDPEMRRRITVQIQLRRKRTITEAYWGEIAKQHGFVIDDEANALAFSKLPPDVNPENRPKPEEEVKPIVPFTAEERDKTLFTLDGQKHTLGEFSDKYDVTSWFERPKQVTGAMGVRYWVRDRWMKPLYLERARKDGIYELPEVADEVKLRREQMMVTMLHDNLIDSQAPEPTDAQLQEFYDKHKTVYVDKEKRRVNLIFNEQERVVRRAWDEIQSGKDFVEVAVRYNENATKPEDVQTGDFGLDTPEFKEIAPQAFGLKKVGDKTEPFKTTSFWVAMQLANITPERPLTLAEIHDSVKEDVKSQWSEDKLNSLLAEWRKNVKVDVNDAVLERAEILRTDVFVPGKPAPKSQASN